MIVIKTDFPKIEELEKKFGRLYDLSSHRELVFEEIVEKRRDNECGGLAGRKKAGRCYADDDGVEFSLFFKPRLDQRVKYDEPTVLPIATLDTRSGEKAKKIKKLFKEEIRKNKEKTNKTIKEDRKKKQATKYSSAKVFRDETGRVRGKKNIVGKLGRKKLAIITSERARFPEEIQDLLTDEIVNAYFLYNIQVRNGEYSPPNNVPEEPMSMLNTLFPKSILRVVSDLASSFADDETRKYVRERRKTTSKEEKEKTDDKYVDAVEEFKKKIRQNLGFFAYKGDLPVTPLQLGDLFYARGRKPLSSLDITIPLENDAFKKKIYEIAEDTCFVNHTKKQFFCSSDVDLQEEPVKLGIEKIEKDGNIEYGEARFSASTIAINWLLMQPHREHPVNQYVENNWHEISDKHKEFLKNFSGLWFGDKISTVPEKVGKEGKKYKRYTDISLPVLTTLLYVDTLETQQMLLELINKGYSATDIINNKVKIREGIHKATKNKKLEKLFGMDTKDAINMLTKALHKATRRANKMENAVEDFKKIVERIRNGMIEDYEEDETKPKRHVSAKKLRRTV